MTLAWCDEPAPPAPLGMVAVADTARRLLAALAALPGRDTPGETLQVSASDGLLLVTGAETQLPWIDGACYIAPREDAPTLWLPTTQRPAMALDLLARAVERQHGASPALLLPAPARVVPLHRRLPLDAGLLRQIAARWQQA